MTFCDDRNAAFSALAMAFYTLEGVKFPGGIDALGVSLIEQDHDTGIFSVYVETFDGQSMVGDHFYGAKSLGRRVQRTIERATQAAAQFSALASVG